MDSKHLRQLLKEDQEPFVLKNYIDERRCQFKRQVPKTHLLPKTRKPIAQNPSFHNSFCKNACFFSFNNSPDVKKSPLFDFTATTKSPITDSNTLFVHIPSRTATLLLEAALRVQKESSTQKPKTPKNLHFGFLGSILKRITHRKSNRKSEIEGDEVRFYVKDILSLDLSEGPTNSTEEEKPEDPETTVGLEVNRIYDVSFSCSCNGRLSSGCCESNKEKPLDLETSTSIFKERINGDFSSCDHGFRSSPFPYVQENNSSPSRFLPELDIPATSPSRCKKQAVKNEEEVGLDCAGNDFKAEEKEQCSPVSVLDPQFDKEEEELEYEEEEEEKDGFELERDCTIVQRMKQQLLHKLRRFERLAALDPIELEKRIAEEEDVDLEEEGFNDSSDDDSILSNNDQGDVFIKEVLSQSNFFSFEKIPSDMKRLILDLMAEEEGEEADSVERELLANKLCKRLDSWKEVETDPVDMMVELNFRSEGDEWVKNREHVQDIAVAIELAIFSFLVEEISTELIHSTGLSL